MALILYTLNGSATVYIDKHYKEPITLQDAADKLMLNKEYFCRFFKQNIGISFITYVNQVRIHHIYHDLVHTEDPTIDIMERHWFFNQKLFYKMFKEIYDCTPRELRMLAKDNPYM
ncbi:helix-turn-helix transcriptional regulator [Clostridium sp. C105KSO13]|uniref:helix-turn-helix transcriptional regulator n=1 Tax=Clostridium sp. C105KSO13 TaxID=1776045 RepID=UPI000B7F98FF|nr:helix-turn-helix transcriptional regulator [Clostridium sp. C105KSO13]